MSKIEQNCGHLEESSTAYQLCIQETIRAENTYNIVSGITCVLMVLISAAVLWRIIR